MTSSLLVATAGIEMLVMGLTFLKAWEAYLDARFLTMIAVLEEFNRGQTLATSATKKRTVRTFRDL